MHAEMGEVITHVQHVVHTVDAERPRIIKQTVQKPIIQEKISWVTKHVEECGEQLGEPQEMRDTEKDAGGGREEWSDPRLYVCQAPNAFKCVSPCGSILG